MIVIVIVIGNVNKPLIVVALGHGNATVEVIATGTQRAPTHQRPTKRGSS